MMNIRIKIAIPIIALLVLAFTPGSGYADISGDGPVEGGDWTSPSTGMEFVWIDEMELWVGKYEVTNEEYREKKPNHYSGKYEVTNEEYREKKPDHDSKEWEGHSLNHDRQPVVFVNFDDAQNYAQWLTEQDQQAGKLPDDYHYRLPTGDEWMTFAQVGDDREYPWGDNWPPESGQAGNYMDKTAVRELDFGIGVPGYDDGHAVTAEVDKLWRNPWGLYGVGGNVWEFTTKTPGGDFDARRGASWFNYSLVILRCSGRCVGISLSLAIDYGFRLLLSRSP